MIEPVSLVPPALQVDSLLINYWEFLMYVCVCVYIYILFLFFSIMIYYEMVILLYFAFFSIFYYG